VKKCVEESQLGDDLKLRRMSKVAEKCKICHLIKIALIKNVASSDVADDFKMISILCSILLAAASGAQEMSLLSLPAPSQACLQDLVTCKNDPFEEINVSWLTDCEKVSIQDIYCHQLSYLTATSLNSKVKVLQ